MSGNTQTGLKTDPELERAELLKGVPANVIEIIGEQVIVKIEEADSKVRERLEYAKASNPFEKSKVSRPLTEALREEALAISELDSMAAEGGNEQAIINISRQQAAMLREFIDNFFEVMSMFGDQTNTDLIELKKKLVSINGKIKGWEEVGNNELEEIKKQLEELALNLPPEATFKDLAELMDYYTKFQLYEAKAVAALEHPELIEEKRKIMGGKVITRKGRARLAEINKILIETGLNKPEVQAAYTTADAKELDSQKLKRYDLAFGILRDEATAAGGFFKEAVLHSTNYYTDEFLQELGSLHDGNTALLKERVTTLEQGPYDPNFREDDIISQIDEALKTAIVVESYVSKKVTESQIALHHAIKGSIMKPTEQASSLVKRLKDNDIQRAFNELEKRRQEDKEQASRATVIEIPQERFFDLCAQARKMLNGGHKLEHPDAERLSRELQEVNLGKKHQPKKIEIHHKGLLVSIVTGSVDRVLKTVETFRYGVEFNDPMIDSLKTNKPEVHMALLGFKPDVAILELQKLLGDENYLNAIGAVLGQQVDPVREKVNELAQKVRRRQASEEALARLAL